MTPAVVVPGYAIASGGVAALGICPRHGCPTTRVRTQKFISRSPAWLIVIAVMTLLVAAIVAEAIRKNVSGPIPACDACLRDQRRFRLQVTALWVADLVVLIAAIGKASGLGLLGFLVLLVAATVWSFQSTRHSVGGFVSPDGAFVTLKKVDDRFAAAHHRAMGMVPPPPPPVLGTSMGRDVLPH